MKKMNLIYSLIFLVSARGLAQQRDSIPVKPLVEKGAAGDQIIGKDIKRTSLSDGPQRLDSVEPAREKKTGYSKKRKGKHKK